ncbi:Fn3-like domain-containing protein [Patescibacteria group bacterium]|nr:Fn3-like domain-containing protein [Patescibacteria group bacterium]
MSKARLFATGLLILGSVFLVSLFAPVPAAHADTISISPPKYELLGNPGDIVSEKLKVTNLGGSDATYNTTVQDFTASGEAGGVNLVDPNSPRTTYSLAKWVTIEPSSFTVPAGKEKIVNFTIHIPQNAEPGGHYASVIVETAGAPVVGGGASVVSHLNSLILLTVSGKITNNLALETFQTTQSFYQFGPVAFNFRTHNNGNVHEAPQGAVTITDTFGHKVAELPLPQANVLPSASRLVTFTWDKKNLVGRYTASLVATYGSGQTKTPLTATTTFYVVPFYLVWTVVGVIILIILLIAQRKRFKKLLHAITSD